MSLPVLDSVRTEAHQWESCDGNGRIFLFTWDWCSVRTTLRNRDRCVRKMSLIHHFDGDQGVNTVRYCTKQEHEYNTQLTAEYLSKPMKSGRERERERERRGECLGVTSTAEIFNCSDSEDHNTHHFLLLLGVIFTDEHYSHFEHWKRNITLHFSSLQKQNDISIYLSVCLSIYLSIYHELRSCENRTYRMWPAVALSCTFPVRRTGWSMSRWCGGVNLP